MVDDNGLSETEKFIEEAKLQIRQLLDELELKAADPSLSQQMDSQGAITRQALVADGASGSRSPETRIEIRKYHELLVLAADQLRGDQANSEIADIKIIISEAKLRYEAGDLDYALELLDDEESGIFIYAQTESDRSDGLAELCAKLDKLIDLLYRIRG